MQLFTVSQAGVKAGLPIVRDPFPHIAVGEPGRGRFEARLAIGRRFLDALDATAAGPCPRNGFRGWSQSAYGADTAGWITSPGGNPTFRCIHCGTGCETVPNDRGGFDFVHPEGATLPPPTRLHEADVLRSQQRGTLLLVEPTPGDRRALVALRFTCGYRGSVTYTAVEPVPCPNRGVTRDGYGYSDTHCRHCGVTLTVTPLAEREPSGAIEAVSHPADTGEVFTGASWPPAGVTVLATGQVAQGDAGRAGGGPEHIAVFAPGATVRVRREGRLYGDDGRYVVAWDGVAVSVTPWLDWVGRQAVVAEEEGERL